MLYLIYQPGKVASQTLESTILASDPSAKVERHHYLDLRNLAEGDRICELAESGEQADSFRHQNAAARAALAILAKEDPKQTWVLTGFRDPLDFAISAFFQNLAYFYPSYSSPALGENYDRDRFDVEVDKVIVAFKTEVAGFFERLRTGVGVRNLRELELRIKLHNLGDWFDRELKSVFEFDAYDIAIAGQPFVRFSSPKGNFLLYRMETLGESLPALLAQLPLASNLRVVNVNRTAEKDYAVLYRRFRERFTPTAEMMEYYYGGRFFRHFYGEAEPLYQEHREGNRLLRRVEPSSLV